MTDAMTPEALAAIETELAQATARDANPHGKGVLDGVLAWARLAAHVPALVTEVRRLTKDNVGLRKFINKNIE